MIKSRVVLGVLTTVLFVLPTVVRAADNSCHLIGIEVPDRAQPKKIALTFDDGPNPETTPHVLDVLKKYNIKTTFFLIGENIKGNEAIVRRELAEGHNIGVHTWTHPHIPKISIRAMHSEMTRTMKLVESFPKTRPHVMRFPYGESTCTAETYVQEKGYDIVGWHLDSCDWSYGEGLGKSNCVNPELQKRFKAGYEEWIDYQLDHNPVNGGIILMHDAEDYEAANLEKEILHLKAEGYEFVELDKGLFPETIPNFTTTPPPPSVN